MNYFPIPTYINQADYEYYNTQLNEAIRTLLGDDFWIMPSLSTSDSTTLEPNMPVGAFWFNTDLAKMQLKTASGVIETVSSS